jgi:hypothetical protein
MRYLNHLIGAFLLCALPSFSQSGQFFLGTGGKDLFEQIIPTADSNFIALGTKQTGDHASFWLLKLNSSGTILWEKTIDPITAGSYGYGHGLTVLPDGGFLISGEEYSNQTFDFRQAAAIRTDAGGNVIWHRTYSNVAALHDAVPKGDHFLMVGRATNVGTLINGILMEINGSGILQWKLDVNVSVETEVKRIFATADGNYLMAGRANVIGVGFYGVFITKIQPDGTKIWQKTEDTQFVDYSSPSNADYINQPLGAVQMQNGDLWLTNPNNDVDLALLHYRSDGKLLSKKIYGSSTFNERPFHVLAMPSGKLLITGATHSSSYPPTYLGFAALIDTSGYEYWRNYYGSDHSNYQLLSAAPMSNGGFMMAGVSNDSIHGGLGGFDGWLVRINEEGNSQPWILGGKVILDVNGNCQADPGEPPAQGWFLTATDTAAHLLVTGQDGTFKYFTNDASFQLKLLNPDPVNWTICQNDVPVVCNSANPASNQIFLVKPNDGGCPRTVVSITQPNLVRCQGAAYFITVRNEGTGPSSNLLLHVSIDPFLTLTGASIPYTPNGDGVDFEMPPMNGLAETIIKIETLLSCDVQLGATHAVSATLTPVECKPNWDGPIFSVKGRCAGNSVQFDLKNEGGGGSGASSQYRVMADQLVVAGFTPVALPEGAAAQTLSFPADGRTWRVELDQATGYPGLSHPSATVEGCGTGANGLYSVSFENAWRADDGVIGSATALVANTTGVPNKVAEAPRGLGYFNLVADKLPLEYTARMLNPLAVPATEVEFVLTFSPTLDVSTFQALSYNAPIQTSIDGAGALHVKMKNVQIDTGTGPDAYAMVRFRIKPFQNTPPDSAQASNYLIRAVAFVNHSGPFPLSLGFHNYSQSFPNTTDPDYQYPPEILQFSGRGWCFANGMVAGSDGSAFLAGETNSFSERTNYDGLIIKTDPSGRALWLNAVDAGYQAHNYFKSVASLPDGGCLAAGSTLISATTNGYLSDYYGLVARLDASGKVLWQKKFRPSGPSYGAWVNGIIGAPDGNFILYGYEENTSSGQGAEDQFYVKIDPNGNILWKTTPVIAGSSFEPGAAAMTTDGNVVFMGQNVGTTVNNDVYLEKIDQSGHQLWHKGYDSLHGIYLGGLAPAPDGGIMLSGYSQWAPVPNQATITPTFMRFSAQGDSLWEKNPLFGMYTYSHGLIPAPGGGYLSAGEGISDVAGQGTDIYLLKIDENADSIWSHFYIFPNAESAVGAVITSANQVLLWGNNQPSFPLDVIQGLLVRTDLNGQLFVGDRPEPFEPTVRVMLYPNPADAHTWVSVSPDPGGPIPWQVFNETGQLVASGTAGAPVFEISTASLPIGIYEIMFPGLNIRPQRLAVIR